jgi:hypothetical protein
MNLNFWGSRGGASTIRINILTRALYGSDTLSNVGTAALDSCLMICLLGDFYRLSSTVHDRGNRCWGRGGKNMIFPNPNLRRISMAEIFENWHILENLRHVVIIDTRWKKCQRNH